ncbi:uncharacterized protein YegL [Catenulispora sp. GAS73]|uniref:vWA domain-containing protein n=1 Tax=Catenulispora sp. GAS73 TaxID=3156269 RepID=UPI00351848AE
MTEDFSAYTMKQKCLPTYIVIDASTSMTPHQTTLNNTLAKLHGTLAMSPRVSEFAHISVIAFSTNAHLVIPMTEMDQIPGLPDIVCNGETRYGEAFDLVRSQIDIDVDNLVAQQRAVLRPAVFFLTDGAPTDKSWEQSFRHLVDRSWKRRPHVITYGFGGAPSNVMAKVSTKAAFVAEGGIDQEAALAEAINSLLNSLVQSSLAETMQIPSQAAGYISITPEYMD